MLNLLRSTLYMFIISVVTIPYAFISIMTWPFPPQFRYRVITGWSVIAMWFIRHILGIRYRVIGKENLPSQPSVILCKHQSAWETISVQRIFPPVAFVLKRELLLIPFFGWGLARMPIISIDRKAGKDALMQVVDQGKERLSEGFWVVVFPEGTRAAPGHQKRYKAGGAALAVAAGAPVVPVAHNAGEFWRKNAFVKHPGEIIVSIGPVIETVGRSAEEVNKQTEMWIEAEMRRLFPHHYAESGEKVGANEPDVANVSKQATSL